MCGAKSGLLLPTAHQQGYIFISGLRIGNEMCPTMAFEFLSIACKWNCSLEFYVQVLDME